MHSHIIKHLIDIILTIILRYHQLKLDILFEVIQLSIKKIENSIIIKSKMNVKNYNL